MDLRVIDLTDTPLQVCTVCVFCCRALPLKLACSLALAFYDVGWIKYLMDKAAIFGSGLKALVTFVELLAAL